MTMMQGSNAPVPIQKLTVRVLSGVPIDVSSFRLYGSGKVRGDADMVFYGQPVNDDNSVKLSGSGNDTFFTVDIPRLHPEVQKLAFTATCDGNMTIADLKHLIIQIEQNGSILLSGKVDIFGRQEAALILGEIYRRNSEWKFRFIAQGFNGGLKPLAEHFGVDILDSSPASSVPSPEATTKSAKPSTTKISLSKVSLTKEKPSISLAKQDSFGLIKINLNWNQEKEASGRFFSSIFSKQSIDLDLGAFIQFQDGAKTVVQALGNTFGRLNEKPFVELMGDDRTGMAAEGEWLHINGDKWKDIRQILIYTFIYKGVASWDKTDGVVTLYIPGQPPIETCLTEGANRHNMCAIARLVNENGTIHVERINRYFKDHQEMDRALGWGFRWVNGSK